MHANILGYVEEKHPLTLSWSFAFFELLDAYRGIFGQERVSGRGFTVRNAFST